MQYPQSATITRGKSRAGRFARRGAILLAALTILILSFGSAVLAQTTTNPEPVETYYIPVTEKQALSSLQYVDPDALAPMYSYTSIAIGTDNTIIYYDHWENGFVPQIAQPTDGEIYKASQPKGVQIWGNGNCADGFPNNKNGVWNSGTPTCNSAADDTLKSGNVILLRNEKSAAQLTTDPINVNPLMFDGRDKFAATEQISVVRAYWGAGNCSNSGPGTCLAEAMDVYPTVDWGTFYVSPVGQDYTANGQFQRVAFLIMATQDDTSVSITNLASGAVTECSAGSLTDLDQGQSCLVKGVNRGATITSSKPVEVQLATGKYNANSFQYRVYTLIPRDQWSSSYYSPLGSPTNNPTQIFVYNPGQGVGGSGALHVRCEYNGTSADINNIASGTTAVFTVPGGSGAHCYAKKSAGDATQDSNAKFFAIGSVDSPANSNSDGGYWDWGFTLVPDSMLAPQALVGLGLGMDPNYSGSSPDNGSPVWVTPACAVGTSPIYVFADINGDGKPDKVDLNGDLVVSGTIENNSDKGILVTPLQSLRIFRPNVNGVVQNQTGIRVWTLNASLTGGAADAQAVPNCNLAVAWGEDPASIAYASPGLDVGSTVRPLRSFTVNKTIGLATDTNDDGAITPGDRVTYTIDIKNTGLAPVTNINVRDSLPITQVDFVAGSTQYAVVSGAGVVGPKTTIPDSGTGTPFPLDGTGWTYSGQLAGTQFWLTPPLQGQTLRVTFLATIKTPASAPNAVVCGDTIKNSAFATIDGTVRNDDEYTLLTCPSTIEIIKQANGGEGTFNFTTTTSGWGAVEFPAGFQNFTLAPAANGAASKVMKPLLPGKTYVVTEAAPVDPWIAKSLTCVVNAGDSTFTVDAGARKATINLGQASKVTCTYTNEKKGTLIVEKVTNPANSNVGFNFTSNIPGNGSFSLTGVAPAANTRTISVAPGAYTVTEAGTTDWSLSNLTCNDANSTGNVATGVATYNVEPGETVKCTFTNKRDQGTIEVIKKLDPETDLGKFNLQINNVTFASSVGHNGTTGKQTLDTGTKTIGETPAGGTLLANYNTSIECKVGDVVRAGAANVVGDASRVLSGVLLNKGEEMVCTITNARKSGTLVVAKTGVGGDGTFTYDATGGLPTPFTIATTGYVAGSTNSSGQKEFGKLPTGQYVITESSLPAGWDFTSLSCSGDANGSVNGTTATVNLDEGENVICTYTNTKRGSLTVTKALDWNGVTPDENQLYNICISGPSYPLLPEPSQELCRDFTAGESHTFDNLLPGEYIVREESPTTGQGWVINITPSNPTVAAGGNSVVTVSNKRQQGTLIVTKAANATFTRSFTWDVAKSVTPAVTDLFDGETGEITWKLEWTRSAPVDTNHRITGTITVQNNAPVAPVVINKPVDKLNGVTEIPLTCAGITFPRTIPAGQSIECTYDYATGGAINATNYVTVTTTANAVYTNTAPVAFGEPTTVLGASATISDTNGSSSTINATGSMTYTEAVSCAQLTDGSYVNGVAGFARDNTVEIVDTDARDTATANINCYRISVEKDAQTALTRTYDWDIYKSVTPTSTVLYEDGSVTLNYTVGVTKTGEYTDSAWTATGAITVTNPAPKAAQLSSLEDTLSDGTPVTIDCAVNPTVPAAQGATPGKLTCAYSATPASAAPLVNTAKAILAGQTFTGTANVDFSAPLTVTEVFTKVNVEDINTNSSTLISVTKHLGPWTGNGSGTYEVPVYCADYSGKYNSTYKFAYNNDATIVETGDSTSAIAEIECIKYGKISLTKSAQGAAEWSFDFTLNSSTKSVTNAAPTATWDKLVPNQSYTLTEVDPGANWITAPPRCSVNNVPLADIDGATAGFQIALQPGQNVVCEAENIKKATISVEKVTVPANSTETFVFSGDLAGTIGNGGVISAVVPAGSYTATESVPAGWQLTSIVCSNDASSGTGAVATLIAGPGEEIKCTFTNTQGLARIFFDTPTATNAVGTPHSFTVTVQTSVDNGGSWQPVDGQVVTGALVAPVVGTLSTPTCTTNSAGQCALVVTSNDAGVTTLNATANVNLLGLPITVSTSGTTGLARDAAKTWADLHIHIDPKNATNPVNAPHTFTVTVQSTTDGVNWSGVANANPVISYIGTAPATGPLACTAATGTDGKCTFTINSAVVGVFTAQASVRVELVPGQPLTRTTGESVNMGLGGSSNAVKRYEEGSLKITKVVTPSFTRTFTWQIEKVVTPERLDLFDGQTQRVDYTVTVTRSAPIDTEHKIAGTVTISNTSATNPVVIASVEDVTALGTTITLNCGTASFPGYVLAGGAKLECSYAATAVNPLDTANNVTVTTTSGTVATTAAAIGFTTPTLTVNDSITVTDSLTETVFGPFTTSAEVPYGKELSCTTQNMSEYVEGVATGAITNTATINYGAVTGADDNATVDVNCYQLLVSKTADPTFDNRYTWAISKTVVPTEVNLLQGETADLNYTVQVTRTGPVAENFGVSGVITVTNPHPTAVATLQSLTDKLSNFDPDTGANAFDPVCASLDVPANGGKLVCSYGGSVVNVDPFSIETNTATATFLDKVYYGQASVEFEYATVREINPSITVTDTNQPLPLGESVSENRTFTYTLTTGCENTIWNAETDLWEKTLPNIAQIRETGQNDNASVDVSCEKAGKIIVEKVTDPAGTTQLFDFTSTIPNGSSFQLSDGMTMTFGVDAGTYTITEIVPATGWDLTDASCVLVDEDTDPIGEPQLAAASIDMLNGPANPLTVTVDGGETWQCTFTNTEWGNLAVQKIAPDDAAQLFTFESSIGGEGVTFATLKHTESYSVPVRPGYYNVTELVPAGWTLREISENCMGLQPSAAQSPTYGVSPTGFAYVQPGLTTTCVFTNSLPSIVITKTATPEQVPNPGADVVFNVSVKNTSKLDPMMITSLTDSIYGDITTVQGGVKATTCVLNTVLQPGDLYTCNFTAYVGVGEGVVDPFEEIDWVTARGITDKQAPVEDKDDAKVVVLAATATVGDFVWLDRNPNGATTPEILAGDGLQNDPANEPGVNNIAVQLMSVGPDGLPNTPDDVIVASTTTDGTGKYDFKHVAPGKYYMVFTKSDNSFAWSSKPNVGGDPTIDSDVIVDPINPNRALTGIINVVAGTVDYTWDAALVDTTGATSSDLGDFVWNDLNKNGVQDAGEPGLANIKVDLYLTGGATPFASTTTDANGFYFFRGLDPATYYIVVNVPSGYSISPRNASGNPATDSDIDANGRTANIVLPNNFADFTWDAGLFVTPTADAPSEEPAVMSTFIFLPAVQR